MSYAGYIVVFHLCLSTTDINQLVSGDRGPCSKYEISLPEGDFKGELEILWEGEVFRVRRSTCVCTCICIAQK